MSQEASTLFYFILFYSTRADGLRAGKSGRAVSGESRVALIFLILSNVRETCKRLPTYALGD